MISGGSVTNIVPLMALAFIGGTRGTGTCALAGSASRKEIARSRRVRQRFMVYIQGLNPRFYELAAARARHSGIGSGAARRIQHGLGRPAQAPEAQAGHLPVSQSPAAARHSVVGGRNVSPGQPAAAPVQNSAVSQAPAAAQ